ncbi:NUP159 [Candida pseudojiufengensis]|uniref:NUP159 n=1 Tax=Candida pseudojiufengensis TaxID=497109 RepID=UPI00222493F8|nr:NUP159 [Candida pseudojiufengensis]KAI5959140.1 NUP159 [Candida pseudojiufengensis]
MASVQETNSEDYGFKLDTNEYRAFPNRFDLNKDEFTKNSLNLLAINNKYKIIAVSNYESLKFLSIKNSTTNKIELIGEIENVKITQLYFIDFLFYCLNDGKIQTLTIDQIKNLNYNFKNLRDDDIIFVSFKVLNSSNYLALDTEKILYHNSKLAETNISAYAWLNNEPIYTTNTSGYNIHDKEIAFSNETKDQLEDHTLKDLLVIQDKFLIAIYDFTDSKPDYHDVHTYLLKFDESSNKYIPYQIEVAPPFSSANRSLSYYTTTLNDWVPKNDLTFIVSSISIEIGLINYLKESNELEVILPSEDSNRANFPIDEELGEDESSLGFDIFINGSSDPNSKIKNPCEGIEEIDGNILPKIYTLLNNGVLKSWIVYHKSGLLKNELSLKKANENLKKIDSVSSTNDQKEAKVEEPKISNQPSISNQVQSNPFGSTNADVFKTQQTTQQQKSAFGATGLGSSTSTSTPTSTPSQPSGFGSTGFGSTGFGSSGGSKGFGSGFGQASFGASGFGNHSSSSQSQTKVSGFAKFGNTNNTTTTNSTASPFANLANANNSAPSGFAKLGNQTSNNDAKSIFGENKPSPMFGDSTKTSIFGNTKAASSTPAFTGTIAKSTPFAEPVDTSKEPTPEILNTKSPPHPKIATQASQSPSNFGLGKTTNTAAATSSPFGQFDKSKTFASPFANFNKPTEPSPFAQFKKSDITPQTPEVQNVISSDDYDEGDGDDENTDKEQEFGSELDDEFENIENEDNYLENSFAKQHINEEGEDESSFNQSKGFESFVDISKNDIEELEIPDDDDEDEEEDDLLDDQILNKEEIENSNESNDSPIAPVQFLFFDGYKKPMPKTNKIIEDKIREIVLGTEGSMRILKKNVQLLGLNIHRHELSPGTTFNKLSEISNLKYDKSLYINKLEYLKETEEEISKLTNSIIINENEKIKIDKLFTQLKLLEKGTLKNLKFLKNRPLENSQLETQQKLNSKFSKIKNLESKLVSLLMTLKLSNSLNSSTISKIENIIYQLNNQILEHKSSVDELIEKIESLKVSKSKDKDHDQLQSSSLVLKPKIAGSGKLLFKKKLMESNSSS